MKIGCPKEIKNNENRIGLTPNAVHAYVAAGHSVMVEQNGGAGSAIADEDFVAAGAEIVADAEKIWADAEMIVKVKEPLPCEYALMRENQILYTYLHLAADRELTEACLERKIIGVAYETVQVGRALPLLKPMSEVAGRMAAMMGAFYSAKTQGGRGLLPMGVTGVAPADIVVLGGGIVGTSAARIAAGLGAKVSILDVNLERLAYLSEIMPANVQPLFSDPLAVEEALRKADIVIGAVLIPGAAAPKLVKRSHLKIMKPGAVVVDVAIDQGGCFESSHPTTHSEPIFVEDGIIHYCVANMPGAYARTSTFALNNATLSYGLELAGAGAVAACKNNPALKLGLNVFKGSITYPAVAEALNMADRLRTADELLS
ncbi:MAG: alanine dehydrogenase [Methylobacteriaceae bacterium]|jgi:alanine dehydrogenase|nr:alanine dehydrogenase [Methylobacteriaceae bacterium]